MAGEIAADDFVACLPITSADKASDESVIVEFPTRLQQLGVLEQKAVWNGRLPPTKLHGMWFPAEKVRLATLPLQSQVVLEGRLCSTSYIATDGSCSFDKALISGNFAEGDSSSPGEQSEEINPSPASDNTQSGKQQQSPATEVSADEAANDDEKEKCPVCRFMKVS